MKHYQYLVLGGGLAGDAAIRGIRELDPQASSIGMISLEPDPPYTRPNLSKGLWKGRPIEKIWRNTQNLGAELHLARQVTVLDPQNKIIRDDKGDEYTYTKLLLATGGSPIALPFGKDAIIYFRYPGGNISSPPIISLILRSPDDVKPIAAYIRAHQDIFRPVAVDVEEGAGGDALAEDVTVI